MTGPEDPGLPCAHHLNVVPRSTRLPRARRGTSGSSTKRVARWRWTAWSSCGRLPIRRAQMRLFSVPIEDREDLRWCSETCEPVGSHRVELGGLAGLDENFAIPENQSDGAFQDVEPVTPWVNSLIECPCERRDAHLHDDPAGGVVQAGEWPIYHAVRCVACRPDDDVVAVVVACQNLVHCCVQGSGQVGQVVDSQTPMPGLDPADGGGTDQGASGQLVERPALGQPQAAQTAPGDVLDSTVLLHGHDGMPKRERVPAPSRMVPVSACATWRDRVPTPGRPLWLMTVMRAELRFFAHAGASTGR